MTKIDPYKVLEVDSGASLETVREAYRALARRFHPDVADDPEAQDRMVRINAAWELLSDEALRAEWDDANGHPMAPDRASQADDDTTDTADAPTHGEYQPGGRAWRPTTVPGTGAAGPPPGRPSGSVLAFGRHLGWSLGEIARVDPGYLLWLDSMPEGRPYADEIDALLRRLGIRRWDEPQKATVRRRFGLS
jgi:curved DNA-binding protein CbpA